MEVITFEACRGCVVSHVINDEPAWDASTFPRGGSVKKTFVEILTVKDVMDVTPGGLVVAQVVLRRYTAGLPVMPDVLLNNNGFHCRNVNFPLAEPLGTLNKEIRARQRQVLVASREPTIGSTGKEGTNFDVEAPTFKNLDCRAKKICQAHRLRFHATETNRCDLRAEEQWPQRAHQCRRLRRQP